MELSNLRELFSTYTKLCGEVELAENILKIKSAARDDAMTAVVNAMEESGLEEFKIDGTRYGVDSVVRASVSQDNMESFAEWCDDNGHADLLNHTISASFKRGEREDAERAATALNDAGVEASARVGVHNSTLRAWVRTQLENGEDVPPDDVCKVHIDKKVVAS